ncbi:MAG: hypothetical protein U1E89_01740 [Burkholderiaceae bacterium]
MVDQPALPQSPDEPIPALLAADLQDHLMTASNDLDRLQRLLHDATLTLMTHFHSASEQVGALNAIAQGLARFDPTPLQRVIDDLRGAVTALQFQDMASQLIAHTDRRLRSCADRLARDALAADGDTGFVPVEPPPLRPNPVTQDEIDAGSIELF